MPHRRQSSTPFRMLPLALTMAVLLLDVLAAPSALLAQATNQQVYMSVVDRSGLPITDLGLEEISVQEDGVAREVRFLTPATEPADLAILVDTSGAAVAATTHIRAALHEFVGMLEGGARMSLVTFGDLPRRQVAPTLSVDRVREGISRLFPATGSRNAMQDALVEAVLDLRQRESAPPGGRGDYDHQCARGGQRRPLARSQGLSGSARVKWCADSHRGDQGRTSVRLGTPRQLRWLRALSSRSMSGGVIHH